MGKSGSADRLTIGDLKGQREGVTCSLDTIASVFRNYHPQSVKLQEAALQS